ncbi:MAG: four helix bundle protein [Bacteroidota bacterium]
MNEENMLVRTKLFALNVIKVVGSLNKGRTDEVLCKQLLRSATSVGANYRAARRSRSRADFISRISIAEEEADESLYWLELLSASGRVKEEDVCSLIKEANEFTAIFCASGRTAKANKKVGQ